MPGLEAPHRRFEVGVEGFTAPLACRQIATRDQALPQRRHLRPAGAGAQRGFEGESRPAADRGEELQILPGVAQGGISGIGRKEGLQGVVDTAARQRLIEHALRVRGFPGDVPVVIDLGRRGTAVQGMGSEGHEGIAEQEIKLGGNLRCRRGAKALGEDGEGDEMIAAGVESLAGSGRDGGEEFPGGRQKLAAVAPGELELAFLIEARQGTAVVQWLRGCGRQ